MKHLLTLLFLSLAATGAFAQRNILESLQTDRPGQGRVHLIQSNQIASLIGQCLPQGPDATGAAKTIKTRGFRIQVYAGNNSRVARSEATAMAARVKENFPDWPVYTSFQPPRWLCRVGDFKSMEEAYAALRQLRATGKFKEVAIVREQINIPLE